MAAPIFDLPANEQSNRDRRIDVGAGYVSVGVSQPEHDQAVRECDGHKAAANGPRAGPDEDECKGSNEFRCQCSAVHARSLSLIFPDIAVRHRCETSLQDIDPPAVLITTEETSTIASNGSNFNPGRVCSSDAIRETS